MRWAVTRGWTRRARTACNGWGWRRWWIILLFLDCNGLLNLLITTSCDNIVLSGIFKVILNCYRTITLFCLEGLVNFTGIMTNDLHLCIWWNNNLHWCYAITIQPYLLLIEVNIDLVSFLVIIIGYCLGFCYIRIRLWVVISIDSTTDTPNNNE